MPTTIQNNLFESYIFLILIKISILIVLVFYAIFALLVVRQVDLMSKTLITKISPTLKLISLIHLGFAIGLVVLTWGVL